jgi:predicted metal-dependent hydrolase
MEAEKSIEYRIVYSRRRSIGISVGPDSGVTVRAPYRTSLKAIEKLVSAKSGWIRKHQLNFKSSVRINHLKIQNGSKILFRGKEYSIVIVSSDTNYLKLLEESIEIGLKNIAETEKAGSILEIWYRRYAENLFRKEFDKILIRFQNFNFRPVELTIRSLKRRWGSCTSKGKITLSSELLKLDDIYLEYVILHELCHLKHHNHGKEFYSLLSEVFPDWKQRRSELKRYIR